MVENKIKKGNNDETSDEFIFWIKNLDKNALNLWRESMMNLRQLHGDIWNGVRFFLTINGIIVAAIITILRFEYTLVTNITILILSFIGLYLSYTAIYIFNRHRKYYIEMLLRKTLLDKELGFYDINLNKVNLSFPWSVEYCEIDEMIKDPKKWIDNQIIRKRSISRKLCLVYYLFVAIYIVLIFVTAISILSKFYYS